MLVVEIDGKGHVDRDLDYKKKKKKEREKKGTRKVSLSPY